MSSLSTFATPVAVGVGVVIIGVLLLMRERRSNSSPVASNSAAAEMTASSAPALVGDATSARALLDALDEALLHVDHSGVIVEVNRAGSELLGLPVSSIVGSPFDNWLDEPDRGALGPWITRLPHEVSDGHGGPHAAVEVSVTTTDGRVVPIEVTVQRPDDTGPILVRLTDRDEVAGHRRALDEARHRFHQAFHSAPTGMVLVRLDDGRIVEANESLASMLQRSTDELVGRTLRELTHPEDVRASQSHRAQLELGVVDSYLVDQRYRRRDGAYLTTRTRVSVSEDDGILFAIHHIEDVTEERRTAEQLTHAARHDELTGIANRSYFMQVLEQRLTGSRPGLVGLLFIDLDHFKVVNDSLGHARGDELLRQVAQRLEGAVREGDLLARFGGDEFVVVLDGRGGPVDAATAAERLRAAVHPAVTVDGHEFFVTVSIGWSTNHDAGMSPDEMLRDADAAMYRAKSRGRDCVEAFQVGSHESGMQALRTVGELRRGVERGEIVPYFQPIVELQSGRIVGFEVVARWLHPDRGLLPPAEFLPFAEESGLLVSLGASMMRNSLSQMARWRAAGHSFANGSVAVNVGSRQLVDSSFLPTVVEILDETGLDPDSVWFEITESALLADARAATSTLREIRGLGIHLSVDDFGTGYSSLTYLKRFPVEAIKIDRSFVSGLGIEDEDSTIVEAVIQLGRALGLTVVAEGVESPLQLQRLRDLKCDRGQGYLFGRPRPANLIETELSAI
ncbi:MAG: EAL domain-containing protein [Actinobacteria bacterium]|nr:EAL domain-containing protein [Ilumatobacteraceae bacterium]MDA0300646.1 EAL domain-containing protein [Actinomycetota bacterium]MDA2995195.1 EAL domain-containing protein [Actinomycetota bacterium]